MKDKTCTCDGCMIERKECYFWQNYKGVVSGLDFYKGHNFFFAIEEKTGKFIVPVYDIRYINKFLHKEIKK